MQYSPGVLMRSNRCSDLLVFYNPLYRFCYSCDIRECDLWISVCSFLSFLRFFPSEIAVLSPSLWSNLGTHMFLLL